MKLETLYKQLKTQIDALDARQLIEALAGVEAADFIARPEMVVKDAQLALINAHLDRRLAGEPLSKILGHREFWGLDFITNQHTLDPRPDTETLIEAVLKFVGERKNEKLRILDLGTGTGCIPISLLSELPHATAVMVDISDEALAVAQQNIENHKMSSRVEIMKSDWFVALTDEKFDIITANPPYIPESDIEGLVVEVKNHDPILALSGGKNGLDAYKKIFIELKNFLKPNAHAFFEVGIHQQNHVMRLADESNMSTLCSHHDLGGIARVIEICHGDK